MNKREKILGIVIVVILAGWVVTKYGVFSIFGTISTTRGELVSERKTFDKYVDQLERSDFIEKKYAQIVGRRDSSDRAGDDPGKAFSEFVSSLCKRLGFEYPRIEPPKIEPIEGVDDYSFITLTVNTQGELKSISKLLKGVDRESVLIRSLSIDKRLDNPVLDLTINVARLVQNRSEGMTEKQRTEKRKEDVKRTFNARTQRTSVEEKE